MALLNAEHRNTLKDLVVALRDREGMTDEALREALILAADELVDGLAIATAAGVPIAGPVVEAVTDAIIPTVVDKMLEDLGSPEARQDWLVERAEDIEEIKARIRAGQERRRDRRDGRRAGREGGN